MQKVSSSLKSAGKTIGFIPTMGFLHEGHLSLVKRSKELCDVTIVSIFVNPTQFSPSEDLEQYPHDIEKDNKLLLEQKVDYLFYPDADEIYPENFQTFVAVNHITKKLEGEFRPAHFKGVTTVVNILFNCVMPDHAFFGQKDAQQAAVIKQMVNDLKIPVNIIVCPIVRETDGLAMSSRNVYLSKDERKDALTLYNALQKAKKMIDEGERRVPLIISEMMIIIEKVNSSKLDYIKIVETKSFESVEELKSSNEYCVLVACKFGHTRLIDNELIKVD
ncbi:MAG: pantoate--beta-alanine ligase [Ignavibacteria bacterium]|nr:MAG: pantoate--beta-alanine ligase [Ignavibacteria bacterium]